MCHPWPIPRLEEDQEQEEEARQGCQEDCQGFQEEHWFEPRLRHAPTGASEKVVKAFNKNKLTVISKAEKVTKVKNAKIENFRGVVVVETKSATQKDLKNLKKAFKKSSVAGISLKECIPRNLLPKSAVESGTETETDADALNIKSANMKAAETDADETDAEAEATNATNAASNAAAPATTTDGRQEELCHFCRRLFSHVSRCYCRCCCLPPVNGSCDR